MILRPMVCQFLFVVLVNVTGLCSISLLIALSNFLVLL